MTTETSVIQKEETEAPQGAERASAQVVFRPLVDIIDSPEAIFLVADMPGVAEGGADVSLEKNVLTIRGSVKTHESEGYTRGRTEYRVGDFERVFTISSEIDREHIEATLNNGVLRVTLPKAKSNGTKKVAVKAV
jgi:HSP20 family molecular chaperone IbpA